ncbi:MAG TPA: hypothetical protein VFC82_11230 [Actinomycetaceae bacterium]|nr:hypothetical protein [Actinomycetaceae bacterium]
MGGFSDAYELLVLDHFLGGDAMAQPTAWWVSLYVGDPDGAGAEVAQADYARINNTSWAAASGGEAANSAVVDFGTTESNWGEVTHFGIHTAETGGSLMASGKIVDSGGTPETANLVSGIDVSFEIGSLVLSLD